MAEKTAAPAKTAPAKKTTARRRSRASGETPATEVAQAQAQDPRTDLETPTAADLDVERQKLLEQLGFSRMRMDWRGDDKPVVQRAVAAVEGRILHNFEDAFQIISDLYDIVRTQARVNAEPQFDQFHRPVWLRLPSGAYEEDWTRLTARQKEDFLYRITTRLFEWEQDSANAWAEAMLAKAQWQEKFAVEYDKPMHGTIDDRTAVGNVASADERYFAIFLSAYSRKADAIVRSMERLAQRLKDTLV